eukprot:TRINITY_DN12882_c0_g1_i1.p1 TRINITY_DN12882_c0_g1~~TRINITY_DN12882_c0_g1_i1.p1  ORF type:complete len:644 (-),score=124.35 TRINITY_DN12882_c0_g1_i1:493-2424(-)
MTVQGAWPRGEVAANLLDLIERAGGQVLEKAGGSAGQALQVAFGQRLSRQLLEAAAYGDASSVGLALEQRADPNCRLVQGNQATALHLASASGSPDVVRVLVDAGASSAVEDANGETVLDAALDSGSVGCAAVLLELGLPDVLNTLDHRAARWYGALQALLESCPGNGRTALADLPSSELQRLQAIQEVITWMTRGQLEKTVKPAAPGPETPGSYFSGFFDPPPSNAPTVKRAPAAAALQESREKLKDKTLKKDVEVRRLMFLCVHRGWSGALAALLSSAQGLDINVPDPVSQRPALELALAMYLPRTEPHLPEICQVLADHGARDLPKTQHFQEWALSLSCIRHDMRGVEYWARQSSNLDWRHPEVAGDSKSKRGMRQTALMIAASEGHVDVCARLVELGAQPWLKDASARNSGQLATENGHKKLGRMLEAISTPYVDEKLSKCRTADEKKAFLKSLMPPVDLSAPRPEEKEPVVEESESEPDEPVVAQRKFKRLGERMFLVLLVKSARDLVTDYFQFSCDPIARLEVQKKTDKGVVVTKSFETKCITNTTKPVWNEEFRIDVTGIISSTMNEVVVVSVIDEDTTGMGDHTLMGRIDIKLASWLPGLKRGKEVDLGRRLQFQPSGAKSGYIEMTMWLEDVEE